MPYSTIADLRGSELYQKSATLQGMGENQLSRFVAVYNRVYERVVRNGGGTDQAEAQATAIAMSSAKNALLVKAAALDRTLHYFTPMMPEQAEGLPGGMVQGAEYDYSFVRDNIDIINLAVRGSEFDKDHDRFEPRGRIAAILLPEQAPDGVEVDPDAPFLVAAQYYEDVPESERKIAGISAEWDDIKQNDGRNLVILPRRFTISETPLNGPETGIRKIAASSNPYKASVAGDQRGEVLMGEPAPETNELEAKVASLSSEVDAKNEALASVKTELTDLKSKLASVLDAKKPEEVTPEAVGALGTKLAALAEENTNLANKVAAIEQARIEEQAEAWATEHAEKGHIEMESVEKWASLRAKDPETAETLMPKTAAFAPAEAAKVAALHEAHSGKATDEEIAFLKEAF